MNKVWTLLERIHKILEHTTDLQNSFPLGVRWSDMLENFPIHIAIFTNREDKIIQKHATSASIFWNPNTKVCKLVILNHAGSGHQAYPSTSNADNIKDFIETCPAEPASKVTTSLDGYGGIDIHHKSKIISFSTTETED